MYQEEGDKFEREGGYVLRYSNELDDVPHVCYVSFDSLYPQPFHLGPRLTCCRNT